MEWNSKIPGAKAAIRASGLQFHGATADPPTARGLQVHACRVPELCLWPPKCSL